MSLGDTRLLPRRCPAYRQHDPGSGFRMEHVKACPDTAVGLFRGREGELQAAKTARSRVPSRGALADSPVVAVKSLRIAVGVEPRGGVVLVSECDQPEGRNRMSEPKSQGKSYDIPKRMVWDAWLKVKENGGAAGVDGVTIEQYEENLKGNLYKLWNRMASGSYFPGPVRAVEIPKKGGTRVLGIPNVSDRVAQTVAVLALEPNVEKVFHDDSYGYRPGRSPLDAIAACRKRCSENGWVVYLELKAFFDS